MDSDSRYELGKQFVDRNNNGETHQQIVDDYNVTHDTTYSTGWVSRLKRDYLRQAKANTSPVQSSQYPKRPIEPPPPETPTQLDHWEGVKSKARLGEWQDVQAKLEHDNIWLKVEHDCDNHFPFHDPDAQNLRSEIRRLLQPDIIGVGSDALDAPNIKPYFDKNPKLNSGRVIGRVTPHWEYHINNRLLYDAPRAKLRYIDGNHEEGIRKLIESDENYDLLYRAYVDMISQDNAVYFCGFGEPSKSFTISDCFQVTHGTKATVHTAQGTLRATKNHLSLLVGHSHRPDWYTELGVYAVSCAVGGCGCSLMPHYEERKPQEFIGWQHGYSYAIVNTRLKHAVTYTIPFQHTKTHIWCIFDNEVLKVKKVNT